MQKSQTHRPVARLSFEGCGTPESGPFGPDPPRKTPFLVHFMTKSEPFGPNPPHKTPFLAQFVAKSGPGGCITSPHPTLATGLQTQPQKQLEIWGKRLSLPISTKLS